MAISSYPTPFDAGLLYVILVNIAISVSFVKNHFISILRTVGIHVLSWEEDDEEEEVRVPPSNSSECQRNFLESCVEDFRSQISSITYESISKDCPEKQECSICLSEFEQAVEVDRLPCGHFFHKVCLTKWLNYWNMTCPLCRNHMMPQEIQQEDCPM
ncbi:hypothetical protein OROGR_007412 [Orobanche gracilis]